MATTSFGLNDALAVKLWSKMLDSEALKATDIAPMIGDDANAIIQRKVETSKGSGDKVAFGLRMQLTGDGFTENETAEGNGESLTLYSDSVLVNELGHVVGVKSENTIDAQRVPFDLRAEARDGLADWFAKRLSVAFFNQVCGYTAETRIKYTGLQAPIAPSASRKVLAAGVAQDQDLATYATHKFDLTLLDRAKELARTAAPKVRPIKVNGQEKYVVYLHEFQVTDMRTSTAAGQWLDIQKAAMQGGEVTKSPIYSGALGEYNGIIIKSAIDVPNGINSSTGAVLPNVRRAVLLGAQAAVCAYGEKNSPTKYRWNEELFDHKRRMEVSAWTIMGLKKTVYNATDFGTIVISTYASTNRP
jgi:N4-gp56 family major capsid protein